MPRTQTTAERTPLTRRRVVDEAVRLADADGLGALSMRSVARRLNVEAMSLYHHVANKEDLLDGMVDAVLAEFHLPQVGADWVVEMRARSRSGREVLKRHPWAVGLMDSRKGAGLETLTHHNAVLGCLREAGFSVRLAGHAFALLDAHLYGFLIQELSLPFQSDEELTELADQVVTALPEGALPYFREFVSERVLQPSYDFGDEFDVGLDLILEGLGGQLAALPRPAPTEGASRRSAR